MEMAKLSNIERRDNERMKRMRTKSTRQRQYRQFSAIRRDKNKYLNYFIWLGLVHAYYYLICSFVIAVHAV